MCWRAKQRIDIQLSKLRFEVRVNVFVSRLVLAERKGDFVFNIMYGKFWFDGDFFVQNLDASTELRKYCTLSYLTDWYSLLFDRLALSLIWQIGTLSFFFEPFFFFFFTNDFLPLLIFHKHRFFLKQKAFASEFCKVFNVSKIWQ